MSDPASRRRFNQLVLAAFGGTLSGVVVGCSGGQKEASKSEAAAGKESSANYDENLLLVGDPHICRGLNLCKGQGKSKSNECAGQGDCASAAKHACDGQNACKGQGGCGEHPGQNQCKGQGACAVPPKDETWKKARAKFEELLAKQGKKVGPAPPKA
jgi:hypothetical protein